MTDNETLLRAPQAAAILGLSVSTLAKYRMNGTGPIYAKLGRRIVVYRRQDLLQWVAEQRRNSTMMAENGAAA